MYKHKYQKGEQITTMAQFAEHVSAGNHVYIRGKFNHLGWATGMQYIVLARLVENGHVHKAIEIVKESL